jgi:hypothetical protein
VIGVIENKKINQHVGTVIDKQKVMNFIAKQEEKKD